MRYDTQAEKWLSNLQKRKKNPVEPSTLRRYAEALEHHILPAVGHLPLAEVGNKAARDLVASLKLSPASTQVVLYVLKAVVKSAVSPDGDQLYPVIWNHAFIDAPAIADQKAPQLPLETLQKALGAAIGPDKALYALLAGSGLRVSEVASLEASDTGSNNYYDRENGCVVIRSGKTDAAARCVDLHPDLNAFLGKNLPIEGKLFIVSESTMRRTLRENAGIGDFHRFRRFRASHLDKQNVPNGLKKFWIGHADEGISERYVKLGSDIEARKTWAEQAGLGFSLTSI